MGRRGLDPKAVALWRYQVIEETLGQRLAREVRGKILRRIARTPVRWPSGVTRRVSLATLYRWSDAYEHGGLEALRPAPRTPHPRKTSLSDEVFERAKRLLADDPDLTFTMLAALLQADPLLAGGGVIAIPRSTLQRRLAKDPLYAALKRARARERARQRFVARKPHEIWHLDAKGPVEVRFTSGKRTTFHILTILDDASRAVLAKVVVPSPDLCAAVRVFRRAAERYGLPWKIYLDRASIFDTPAFREGLAEIGVHRIFARSRNPEANGKIEAYHRVLVLWFTRHLKKQAVIDLEHVDQLLDGVIEGLYHGHRHRGLKIPPRDALNGEVSPRAVSAARLRDAFRQERSKKTHPKTGEVDLPGGTYAVPEDLRGQKLTFRIDPDPAVPPVVLEPGTGRHLPLLRAAIRPEDAPAPEPHLDRFGEGPLQRLYDHWRGKVRPVAEPGFGLPEVLELLAQVSGRLVPRSDAEAALVQRLYREIGPLARKPTEAAFAAIGRELGKDRPLKTYLDALARRVTPGKPSGEKGGR